MLWTDQDMLEILWAFMDPLMPLANVKLMPVNEFKNFYRKIYTKAGSYGITGYGVSRPGIRN
jgi:hypothetical protein